MDPTLIPSTAPGRQLAWLINLRAEPSAEDIQDHLEPSAAVDIHVDLGERETRSLDLAAGLLAFGTMVRDLPGALEPQRGCAVVPGIGAGSRGPERDGRD
jgi:hypothetical protein